LIQTDRVFNPLYLMFGSTQAALKIKLSAKKQCESFALVKAPYRLDELLDSSA